MKSGIDKGLVKVLKKEAKQGNLDSLYSLGFEYYFDYDKLEVREDEKLRKKGFVIMKKAADMGCTKAQLQIAKIYKDNHNIEECLKYYNKAAELGDEDAIRILCDIYERGVIVERDLDKFQFWCKKLENSKDPYNKTFLADRFEYFSDEFANHERAMDLYKQAAEEGDYLALEHLYDYYYDKLVKGEEDKEIIINDDGKKVNKGLLRIQLEEKMLYYLEKLVEKERDSKYFTFIGIYYVEHNDYRAFKYLTKARKMEEIERRGYADTIFGLGRCYESGIGTQVDLEKAYEHYYNLAKRGTSLNDFSQVYGFAMEKVGDFYYDGKVVEKDYDKAVTWYYAASQGKIASAEYKLGKCYEEGKGCKQDLEKADEYYKLAAEHGSNEAKNRLYMSELTIIV